MPKLEEEIVFAPPRKWRFDFALERPLMFRAESEVKESLWFQSGQILPANVTICQSAVKIAIEIEGGIWSGERPDKSGCDVYRLGRRGRNISRSLP